MLAHVIGVWQDGCFAGACLEPGNPRAAAARRTLQPHQHPNSDPCAG